jgi:uncharacterized cofD-like protein
VKIVALGGGHGLAATLRSLKKISNAEITAIVGVSDNGGSSGRLRSEFGVLPPGDLRMALTALCDEGEKSWAEVLQFRFDGDGPLAGHSAGNLLITALWQSKQNVVEGLDAVSNLLHAKGRVLPLALTPIDLRAETIDATGRVEIVQGQVEIATTENRVVRILTDLSGVDNCDETLAAISDAEVLVLGPGSWFTSVLTHLTIPAVSQALVESNALKILVLNLVNQSGETDGFSPAEHLEAIRGEEPALNFDFVVLDDKLLSPDVEIVAKSLGWRLVSAALAEKNDPTKHDLEALSQILQNCIRTVERIS